MEKGPLVVGVVARTEGIRASVEAESHLDRVNGALAEHLKKQPDARYDVGMRLCEVCEQVIR